MFTTLTLRQLLENTENITDHPSNKNMKQKLQTTNKFLLQIFN